MKRDCFGGEELDEVEMSTVVVFGRDGLDEVVGGVGLVGVVG